MARACSLGPRLSCTTVAWTPPRPHRDFGPYAADFTRVLAMAMHEPLMGRPATLSLGGGDLDTQDLAVPSAVIAAALASAPSWR